MRSTHNSRGLECHPNDARLYRHGGIAIHDPEIRDAGLWGGELVARQRRQGKGARDFREGDWRPRVAGVWVHCGGSRLEARLLTDEAGEAFPRLVPPHLTFRAT